MVESKPHYHVFLSHNSRDKAAVEPLAVLLREKGLNPFLDKWNLVPGEPIEDALIEALENSDSAVIFVGPGGEGPWQSEEMRDILKRAVKSHNEFRAIPVLLPNASADVLEKSFLGSRLWIEFKDVDDDDALLRLAKAIQGEAYGDESFKLPDEPAPYRGLERFERIEKPEEDFFFGRDDEIRALVERLVKERFVAVVGASGSGKSSLIRAGLTKQLAEEIHPGIRRWQTITVEPGSAPFRSLAVQIAVAAGIGVADRENWIEQTIEKWRAAPDGVRTSLDALFADAKETLLVFIDQFEELFTHGKKNEEHERITRNFVANLVDLWRNGGDRVRVVVALRADFVERCLEIGPLKELLQDRTMLVGEVGDDALREIVKEPAARVGAFLEKGLMERILTEVRNQSGSLPLLQQALHELWRHRRGAWLTHEAFDASGGVARALNDQAQGAYRSLDDAQKKIADSLFPRLITLGEGVADTRRRVRRNELYPQGVEPGAVNAVIDKLSGKDARILVTTREGGTTEDLGSGEDFVEFTHEALLGNWDHLVALLDSERESIRKHRSLTSAAEVWESKPQDERQNFLLHHGQLDITARWATDEGGNARLNQLERRFLDESITERDAEEARKARTARRLKMFAIGAAAAAIMAIVGVVLAVIQTDKAKAQAGIALSRQLASQTIADVDRHLDRALLFSLEAYRIAKSDETKAEAWNSLLAATASHPYLDTFLQGHGDGVVSVAFSSDGKLLASASIDRTIRLWDVAKRQPVGDPLTGHDSAVMSVAFSHNGKLLASGSDDNNIILWDVASRQRIGKPLTGHAKSVNAVAFSKDGRLASGDAVGIIRLWDVASRQPIGQPLTGHVESVNAVAFSKDGQLASGSDDNTVIFWDEVNGQYIGEPINAHEDWVRSVAFSADGNLLASGSYDNNIIIWDVASRRPIGEPLEGHDSWVLSVAFSHDGKLLASGSDDNNIILWDVASHEMLDILAGHAAVTRSVAFHPLKKLLASGSWDTNIALWDVGKKQTMGRLLVGHKDVVSSVVFSPNAELLVSGSYDGTIRLWDVAKRQPVGEPLEGHDSSVVTVAFSADGKLLASGSDDNNIIIWDVASRQPIGQPLTGHDSAVMSVAFSHDGKLLVSGSADRTIRLWDASSWQPVGEPLEGHDSWVVSVAFSPEGELVASGSDDNNIIIWDVASRQRIGKPLTGHAEVVNAVAFSPYEKLLASASNDQTIRLWEGLTGSHPQSRLLVGHGLGAKSVAFSADGKLLASSSDDGTIIIWDVSRGEPRGRLVTGPGGAEMESVALSPDGKHLASGDRRGRLFLWDLDVESWKDRACRRANRNLTKPEWKQFIGPAIAYHPTCSEFVGR